MPNTSLAKLKRYLDPADRIEPGSAYFDRILDGAIDPCVATITFGSDVVRMHVTQSGNFRVGSAQCPMSRDQLAAVARAYGLVAKAGLTDPDRGTPKPCAKCADVATWAIQHFPWTCPKCGYSYFRKPA